MKVYLQDCEMSLRVRWAWPARANRCDGAEVGKLWSEEEAGIPETAGSSERSCHMQRVIVWIMA